MGKRKEFQRSELRVPAVEHTRDAAGQAIIPDEVIPPNDTIVRFPRSAGYRQSWDFAPWYGLGVDNITYAFHRQIERFVAKQDADLEISSVAVFCESGARHFLDYCALHAAALQRSLTLADIDRDLIDGHLSYLRDLNIALVSQRSHYSNAKSILRALGRRKLIRIVVGGDEATFPLNPYPNVNSVRSGESPLPRAQRQAFSAAIKTEVMPLLNSDDEPTSETLTYALLLTALHTGANTTPLLELIPDCLRAHPKEDTEFLTLYKRRGHKTSKVALRADSRQRKLEAVPSVRPTVARVIRRAIELTEPLRAEAPAKLQERVWLYRRRGGYQDKPAGGIGAVNPNDLKYAIRKLAARYHLTDADGKPLRINISRLRKTFANRIFELTEGDLAATAIALGNTPRVAGRNYLSPSEDAPRNWRFMGQCLVDELLSGSLGATARTPMGRCTDPEYGQYAPQQAGASCFQLWNCLRCRNYVVTGDDLYRVLSFKMRVLAERNRIPKRRWQREYAHIPRLIERDVIAEGLRRKVFSQAQVDDARERARIDPHPFWRDAVPSLEDLR